MTKIRLGCLGERTNSVAAALKLRGEYELIRFEDMACVFNALKEGRVERIIVPVENSISGRIEYANWVENEELKKADEVEIPIIYCIGAKGIGYKIGFVLSHEQALKQCSKYLDRNFNDAARYAMQSTEEAARFIAQVPGNGAAIASPDTCKYFKLNVLAEDIVRRNRSKFWVCEK